jgi:hypothetical protein
MVAARFFLEAYLSKSSKKSVQAIYRLKRVPEKNVKISFCIPTEHFDFFLL